jgi:DNA-binding response OmpR family regulator
VTQQPGGERVLVVDDEPDIVALVAYHLAKAGYRVSTAATGPDALRAAREEHPALVVLDLMLPGMSGFDVLEKLRAHDATSEVAVLMLTARKEEPDRIRGLTLGADDYLTKPFSVEELLARVRSVLRRSQFAANNEGQNVRPVVVMGGLSIDFAQHRVTVDEQEIELTPIEYRLLAYLAQNAGRVVTQDLLLEHVWGEEYIGESHLLQVNMNRLRRKIEADPAHPRYIITKMGVGYYLPAQPAPAP